MANYTNSPSGDMLQLISPQGELPSRTKEVSQVYNDHVINFYTSLEKGLDSLERSVGTEFMSLSFVASALELLTTTHAGVLFLIEKLRLPVCAGGEEWLNEYMDETVKLLDVCNVLKTGISGLENYQRLVELVARTVDLGHNFRYPDRRAMNALNVCRQEILRLENDHRTLMNTKIEAEGKLTVNLAEKHVENKFFRWYGFWGVWFTVKNTNSYICRLILCGVVCSGPIPRLTPELVSVKSSWFSSLIRLHSGVTREVQNKIKARKCTFLLSHDIDVFEGVLADLRAQLLPVMRTANSRNDVEKLWGCVRSLRQGSQKVSNRCRDC